MNRTSHRACDALLGAALLNPAILPALSRWISPEVFEQPEDGALWRVLTTLGPDAVHPEGFVRPEVLAAALSALGPSTRAYQSPPRLNQLVISCPDTRNAPLYAGMVLQAAISRAVEQDGQHTQHRAQAAAVDEAGDVLEEIQHTARHLDALGRDWAAAPATVRALLSAPAAGTPPAPPRTVRRRTDPYAEATTVASLLCTPAQAREVGWLRPDDFADPQLAAAYRAITALTARHAAVDPLTVVWEAQRQPGPRPSDRVMTELAHGGIPGAAAHAGRQVLSSAALDRLDTTGRWLRDLGRVPAVSPPVLLAQARTALEPPAADRDRIRTAYRPVEPAAGPGPPPATDRRAGRKGRPATFWCASPRT